MNNPKREQIYSTLCSCECFLMFDGLTWELMSKTLIRRFAQLPKLKKS